MELQRKRKAKKEKVLHRISPDEIYEKGCMICLKRDHSYLECPYMYDYPPGAFVGRFAEIVCFCCGEENAHPGVPGLDWKAIARLKLAIDYPNVDEQLKELNITSAPEAAAYGTEQHKRIRSEGAAYGTGKASRRKV